MGTHLVPLLQKQGHNVRILIRNIEKAEKLFGHSCEFFCAEIENPQNIKGCCDNIDIVYHMAALMGHDLPSREALAKFREINVNGLKNIVKEAKKSNVKRFIFVSSTAALGLQQDVFYVNEHTQCKPYTPYQISKYEGELYMLEEINKNFPAIIIRPSMVYGPGFKGDFLLMAKVCMTGWFPKIGLGKNFSPALYISDLAEALVRFADRGKIGETYMLASKESYTLKETAKIIGKALNKKIKFFYVPRCLAILGAGILEFLCRLIGCKPFVTQRNIKSVSTDRIVDISKTIRDLGFIPQVSLDVGLPQTIEYFCREHYL